MFLEFMIFFRNPPFILGFKLVIIIKGVDQVLLKVVNPNVDVNVDVTYVNFAFY